MIQIQVCIDICNDSISTESFINLFLKIRGCVFHGSSDTNQIDWEIYDVHFYIEVCVVYNGNSINVLDGLKVR